MSIRNATMLAHLLLACGCSVDTDVKAPDEKRVSGSNATAMTEAQAPPPKAAPLEKQDIRLNQYRRDGDEAAAKDFADRNGYASCRFTGNEDAVSEEKLFVEVECSKSDPTLRSPARFDVTSFPPKFRGMFSTDCRQEPAEMVITVTKDRLDYWEAVFTPSNLRFDGRSTVGSDGEISWYDGESPDETGRKPASVTLTILTSGRMLFVENEDAYLLHPC